MDTRAFVKHAQRYGIDGIVETAIEVGIGESALAGLLAELDKISDEAHAKKHYGVKPKTRRIDAVIRAKRLLGIEEETEAAS